LALVLADIGNGGDNGSCGDFGHFWDRFREVQPALSG
jgi:hypothetical protein